MTDRHLTVNMNKIISQALPHPKQDIPISSPSNFSAQVINLSAIFNSFLSIPTAHHFLTVNSPIVSTFNTARIQAPLPTDRSLQGLQPASLRQPLTGPRVSARAPHQSSQSEPAKHTSSHATPPLKTFQRVISHSEHMLKSSLWPTRPHDQVQVAPLPSAPASHPACCTPATAAYLLLPEDTSPSSCTASGSWSNFRLQ